MLKLCICDDQPGDLERLEGFTAEFFQSRPDLPALVETFRSPFDLLERLEEKGGFDIYLLDILMPHLSGLELARKLRERGETAQILFLTSSREYALDAFAVNAAGYLLKPVEREAFFQAVTAAAQALAPADDPCLLLKTREGVRKVRLRELVLVESFDHRRMCTLSNGTSLETSATLTSLLERLKGDGRFFSPPPGLYRQPGVYPGAGGGRAAAVQRAEASGGPEADSADEKSLSELRVLKRSVWGRAGSSDASFQCSTQKIGRFTKK